MSLNAEVLYFLPEEQFVSYAAVALSVGAIYDHLITLDREMRSKWTLTQLLFFISRYLSDAILIYGAVSLTINTKTRNSDRFVHEYLHSTGLLTTTHRSCRHPFVAIAWGGIIAFWASQAITIVRVSSMYNHSRKIVILLVAMFLSEVIITAVFESFFDSTPPYTVVSGGVPVCLPASPPWWSNLFWISIITRETLMLGLSINKVIQSRQELWVNFQNSTPERPSLMFVLLRDSIFFSSMALVISIMNCVATFYLPYSADQICIAAATFGTQVFGSRLILNLREAYHRFVEDEYSEGRARTALPAIAFSLEATDVSLDIA
ncbi:hypothetical protein GALMADRAFT_137199 [Galerina marginata CBS 339.88]|uniref:DUF6533 domain-containing protein n=1 Tax=Galerina marginata (strain CBS 339.88) TaxID=685588 RepID=A0A067TAG1_GALM3|nr:hypothetical protein GALMADRAFT_137199 [Galerina marginata CBS 339.88]